MCQKHAKPLQSNVPNVKKAKQGLIKTKKQLLTFLQVLKANALIIVSYKQGLKTLKVINVLCIMEKMLLSYIYIYI
jgi:hypothetical protein